MTESARHFVGEMMDAAGLPVSSEELDALSAGYSEWRRGLDSVREANTHAVEGGYLHTPDGLESTID